MAFLFLFFLGFFYWILYAPRDRRDWTRRCGAREMQFYGA